MTQLENLNAMHDLLNIIPEKASCIRTCPVCKKGKLLTVEVFDERGPPPDWHKKLRIKG